MWGNRAASNDVERLGQAADATSGLIDDSAHADATGPGEQDPRASTLDGRLQGDGEPRQLTLAPNEALAPGPSGHGGIVPHGTKGRTDTLRRMAHPRNTLNELSGEAWLYFTKSVWTTAYPSELGHRRRKAHGANKPPRLMARLIEYFTKSGELVLDPFAGVGGTLLGAAMSRGPRRAIGIELAPHWADVYAEVVAEALAERAGQGPELVDLGPQDPGGPRPFDPSGCELRVGDARKLLPEIETASIDFVATDPPYNVQLPMTMAGGPLAEAHANRRTDYAMVTDDAADVANASDYPAFLDAMTEVLAEVARYAVLIVRDAYQDGRYIFTAADLASRAASVGLVPKGDLIWYQAGSRLRPYGYPTGFVPNIVHQHLLVFRAAARRPPAAPRARRATGSRVR
jgi:DNA modification methylase